MGAQRVCWRQFLCKVGAPLNRLKLPSKNILLTVPRRYFFCGSFMFFLSCVCYAFVRVCLYVPCGQLLGKGWPLGSRLWCLSVSLSLSHWYPGSGVVLDCIHSWSLHPYLLWHSYHCCRVMHDSTRTYDKVIGPCKVGQSHWVKVPAGSKWRGHFLCKV